MRTMRTMIWAALATLSTVMVHAQSSGPVNTPLLNKAYYFVGTSPYATTIQSAVTAACNSAPGGAVTIPAGVTPSDTIGAVTSGCAKAWINDMRTVTEACYAWSGSTYASTSCGGAGGGAVAVSPFSNSQHLGDSLTAGYTTTGFNQSSYAQWIDKAVGIPIANNFGYPGYTSNQEDTIVYGAQFLPTTLITYLIGTNNYNANPTDTNQEQIYYNSILGQMLWMELASSPTKPVSFATGAVTYAGTWTTDSLVGRINGTNGNTATFTGTGSVLYLTTQATNGNTGTGTLTCDGTATGASMLFAGFGGASLTQSASQTVRVSLAAGPHTCVLRNTSPSGGYVQPEWFAFLPGTTVPQTATMLLGLIPDTYPLSTNMPAWRTKETSAVAQLTTDGISTISTVNTVGATPLSFQYYNDSIHFNNLGQEMLAAPWIAKINTLFSKNYATFVPVGYFTSPMVDYCGGGENNNCLAYGAGPVLTTGQRNLFSSVYAGHNATSAQDNIFEGFSTGSTCTTCTTNTVVGSSAYESGNGFGNSIFGYSAGFRDNGFSNTLLGSGASSSTSGIGSGKVIIGANAGQYAEGNQNVLIGQGAGTAATTTLGTFSITSTQLTSGTATYGFTFQSGAALAVGQLVSVSYTSNGSGIFNVSNVPIASISGATFTVGGFPATPNYGFQSEIAAATTTSSSTLAITSSSLANTGVATFTYTVTTGLPPDAGQIVTITGTTNASGILNCRGCALISASGGTSGVITVGGFFAGVTFGTQAEAGSAAITVTNSITGDFSNTFIGTGVNKSTGTLINNSIAIGAGATIGKSNYVQLGAPSLTGGAIGVNTICISSNSGCTQNGEKVFTYASTSITFDASYPINTIVLTGNITAYNITGVNSNAVTLTGLPFTVNICQDATGGRTFNNSGGTGGTGFRGFFTIGVVPNSCNVQSFVYSLALGAWMATSPGMLNQ